MLKTCRDIQIGKTVAANIDKEEKNIHNQHKLFHKESKNKLILASTTKLMTFYRSSARDAVLLTSTQTNWVELRSKKDFMAVTLMVLVCQMDGWMNGKLPALLKNAVLVMKLAMFQKK